MCKDGPLYSYVTLKDLPEFQDGCRFFINNLGILPLTINYARRKHHEWLDWQNFKSGSK